jgi:hypothetical protein
MITGKDLLHLAPPPENNVTMAYLTFGKGYRAQVKCMANTQTLSETNFPK